jgi:hypothetical protein
MEQAQVFTVPAAVAGWLDSESAIAMAAPHNSQRLVVIGVSFRVS